ncbi:cardiolipin synthase, partial [Clostridium saudiense]|nr:cardiolipin synthase [Clostridium saudiense]
IGIKFSVFFPGILPHINTRINYRNHRKIVVIDGEIGYVGGFNVGNEYVNRGKQFEFWRDTHIRVQGEAVNELNKRFLLDWDYAAEENINDMTEFFPEHTVCGDVGMQIISSGPDHMEEYIKNAYMKIINDAKEYVYIQTPYLVPDGPVIEALKISALSGVDVRIMVPGKPDHFFMEWMLSANIGLLLDYGIKFYRYQKGFIHAKTIVSDGKVCSIGTANLDIRSFKLNFEVNAIMYNERISKEQENIFYKDQEKCKLVTKHEYDNRSRSLRIKESLIRLIAPIL